MKFRDSDDGDTGIRRFGPHSLWGVIALVLTVFVVLPFSFIALAKEGTFAGITIFDKANNWFMTPERVRPDTGHAVSDAHLNVQEVKEVLWKLEEKGRELFGVWHTWQIADYKLGMGGTELLKNSKEPYHQDFVMQFAKKRRIDNQAEQDEVLDKYFYIRVFYSEMSGRLTQLSTVLKKSIKDLPSEATLDLKLNANELLQDSTFAMREIERPMRLIETVIKPYFKPQATN